MPNPPTQPDDPSAGADMSAAEKRHFRFAMILIFSCVFALPALGALWILLMRWGVVARP